MILEFGSSANSGLMEILARSAGRKIENGVLELPANFGKGYIKRISLGPFMDMMIHQYELAEDVKGMRPAANAGSDFITFSFRNVLTQKEEVNSGKVYPDSRLLPSVQVSSGNIDLEMSFPALTKINTIIVNIHVDLLKDLINHHEGNILLQAIISATKPYLYEEIISPEIRDTAAEILAARASGQLMNFYYTLKCETLIYLFFVELLKRKDVVNTPFNVADVGKIYAVRDKVVSDLIRPPRIQELARFSGMSAGKMNRLFKQIFGNTIYNYHQKLRIHEAADLIKYGRLSVSEAGYRMGFTNMSHFTRIFERYIGIKPKKYSAAS